MTQNQETQTVDNSFLSTKFGKVLTTIIAVFLVFAGPTYVVYGLSAVAKLDLAASFGIGFVLFIVGLFLIRILMQKKIIT
jgi:tetrahydromethanopterin S-methyltransferase subunit E